MQDKVLVNSVLCPLKFNNNYPSTSLSIGMKSICFRSLIIASLIVIIFPACNSNIKKKDNVNVFFEGLNIADFINGEIHEIEIDSTTQGELIVFPSKISYDSKLMLSDVIDSVFMIKLETTDQCLIGSIDKIIFKDDVIYINDNTTKSIFAFKKDGSFIRKYGKQGKGPGEYKDPSDFQIHENELIVSDATRSMLIKYDLNGNFKKNVKLGHGCKDFIIDNDGDYVFYTPANFVNSIVKDINNFSLIISDKNGILKHKSFPFLDTQKGFRLAGRNCLVSYNNLALFKPRLANTIYQISKTSIKPLLTIDYGENSIPKGFEENSTFRSLYEEHLVPSSSSIFWNDGKYFIIDDKMLFTSIRANQNYVSLYSFKSKQLKTGRVILDDIASGFGRLAALAVYEDFFVNGLYPFDILEDEGYMRKIKNKETIDLLNSIQKTDNPILVFQRLKEF